MIIPRKSIKEDIQLDIYKAFNIQRCGYALPFLSEQSLKAFVDKNIYSEETLINEATYELDTDVDYIYDNYALPLMKDYFLNEKKYLNKFKKDGYILHKRINTEELPSDIAKQAHKNNPIDIGIGSTLKGSNYDPSNNSILFDIILAVLLKALNKDKLTFKDLNQKTKDYFMMFISEPNLKATIAHELTHWLDDSIHDNRLKKYLHKISKKQKTADQHMLDNITSHIEIQGYIHGVNQFKKSFTDKEWNSITYQDLFASTALGATLNSLKKSGNKQQIDKWKKRIFSRLAREGLVGDSMKSEEIPSL